MSFIPMDPKTQPQGPQPSVLLHRMDGLDGKRARALLATPDVEAIEVPRPSLEQTGYARLVRKLLAAPWFMSDFSQSPPEHAFYGLCKQLLGSDIPLRELDRLLEDLAAIQGFGQSLAGPRVLISVRNWFAPGDLVWHVDRSARDTAYRILWPLGRVDGMRVASYNSIDPSLYTAFMRREHPLLCRLDREVARTRLPLDVLWRHRPQQVRAMIESVYPFLRNGACIKALCPSSISVHRIETPRMRGTYHRSAWGNRHQPGLQVILTVTST